MHQSLHQKKGTLTIEDNQRIVALIKAKINPVHKKTLKLHKNMTVTAPSFYRKPKKQFEVIDSKELETFQILKKQSSIELVRKAKKYIEQKKKCLKDVDSVSLNIDLNMYIQLFDGCKIKKENQHMQEFLKMKRQSMHTMSFYEQPKRVVVAEQPVVEQKTQEEYSLINAKIRRKLNHKKIIQLYKYN